VRRPFTFAAIVVGIAALTLGPATAARAAGERIEDYAIQLHVQPSGELEVIEQITYDFGATPHHGIFRDIPTRLRFDDRYDRLYELRVESVTVRPDASSRYAMEDAGGGLTRIRIGDPDATVTGVHVYTLIYTVRGAMNTFPDHDELYWNAIGDSWSVPIDRATVQVNGPADIVGAACFAGPTGSSLACDRATTRANEAAFSQRELFPYEALTIVVGFPKGSVADASPILEERWSVRRAFVADAPHLAPAVAILLVGFAALGFIVWTRGRDVRYQGSPVDQVMGNVGGMTQRVPVGEADDAAPVEFAPPDGIKPGQAGVLIDERANTVDVVATIVDLAVRGYLVIQEIPKEGLFGKPDWRLVQLDADRSSLLVYERSLLEALFRDGGDVTLSSLRRTFSERLRQVEDHMYVDAAGQGWFPTRPDRVRLRWRALGVLMLIVGAAVAFVAIRFSGYGFVGVAAVVVGLVFVVGASRMPRRTAKGTAILRRVRGYRQVIDTADRYLARWAEQENVFPKTLPYAIVFGLTDKWAKAFASLAEDPATAPSMAWYVPAYAFSIDTFADAIDGFTVATSGTMTATPAGSGSSGFGGGGSSGGGGGGGGGGSW
jgi:uncharacterized protein (TIGR04222 family)